MADFQQQQSTRAGFWAKMGQTFEKITNQSAIYKQWLELLPTQDHYLSVLCGSLKLVICAMARMRKVREEIALVFESLPNMLLCAERADQVFPDDFALRAISHKMLGKTFEILTLIVYELHRSTSKTFGKALLKQDLYADKLKVTLEELGMLRRGWQDTAATSSYAVQHRMDNNLHHLLAQVADEHTHTRATVERVNSKMEHLFRAFLGELHKGLMANVEAPQRITSKGQMVAVEDIPYTGTLPSAFDYTSAHFAEDISAIQDSLCAGPVEVQDQLHTMIGDARFRSWFLGGESDMLLVHENRRRREDPSADSFLCARAAMSLSSQVASSECIPICMFFSCGDHTIDDADIFCGPDGMLRALIGQLMRQIDERGLVNEAAKALERVRKTDSENIKALTRTLARIVQLLPATVILYCILDDVSAFEISEFRDEAPLAVEALSTMATGDGATCVFKLLLTSPEACREMRHFASREDILEVPINVPRVGDFSEHTWHAAVEDWTS